MATYEYECEVPLDLPPRYSMSICRGMRPKWTNCAIDDTGLWHCEACSISPTDAKWEVCHIYKFGVIDDHSRENLLFQIRKLSKAEKPAYHDAENLLKPVAYKLNPAETTQCCRWYMDSKTGEWQRCLNMRVERGSAEINNEEGRKKARHRNSERNYRKIAGKHNVDPSFSQLTWGCEMCSVHVEDINNRNDQEVRDFLDYTQDRYERLPTKTNLSGRYWTVNDRVTFINQFHYRGDDEVSGIVCQNPRYGRGLREGYAHTHCGAPYGIEPYFINDTMGRSIATGPDDVEWVNSQKQSRAEQVEQGENPEMEGGKGKERADAGPAGPADPSSSASQPAPTRQNTGPRFPGDKDILNN
ncbi:hypothetical protein BDV96DRAFT_602175 [Lophiotrema nucula]|uniref:Uncharacterized protein n=1 Tax=Lophiotrema nucula TaxID=690887 RepID=A0A6A5Z168_9PLEO|nr:hypothetical protein BDV96DRAFT_602175 [Lophiotrema nucula]